MNDEKTKEIYSEAVHTEWRCYMCGAKTYEHGTKLLAVKDGSLLHLSRCQVCGAEMIPVTIVPERIMRVYGERKEE